MRLAPVMLALLLALSPVAAAVQASAPTAPDHDRTGTSVAAQPDPDTARLSPPENASQRNTTTVMTLGTAPARTAFGSPSLALGSSLRMDHDAFRTQLSLQALDQQLQAAESVERKKQLLNRYRYRIENRIISLKASERQATQAFATGSLPKNEYLRTLGHIDTAAGQIRNAIEAIQTRSTDVPRFNLEPEAQTLRGQLVTLEGPVRDRIGDALRGKLNPTRIYVSTSDAGIAISTIDGNTYVREVLRKNRRDPSMTSTLSLIKAQNAILNRYPWAAENLKRVNTFRYGSTHIFYTSVIHSQGKLAAYIDGGTKKAFKEVQHKQLTGGHSIPLGPTVSSTKNTEFSGNYTLSVNRTYSGGPLRVKLTNGTGAPIQGGEVTVAGDLIGRTGPDGVLWTLSPAEQFRVSATYDFTTVNVTTSPAESLTGTED